MIFGRQVQNHIEKQQMSLKMVLFRSTVSFRRFASQVSFYFVLRTTKIPSNRKTPTYFAGASEYVHVDIIVYTYVILAMS